MNLSVASFQDALPFFPGTTLCAAILFFSLGIAFLRLRLTSRHPLPPGPPFYSVLIPGPVRDFHRSPATFTDALQTLSNTYGDVFSVWMGTSRVLITAVPADIVHISSDSTLFPRAQKLRQTFGLIVPGGLFCMEHTLHRTVRRKLRDRFNHNMLRGFHGAMSKAVIELCSELENTAAKGEPVDISVQISAVTFLIILQVGFGFDMAREDRISFAAEVTILTEELMTEFMIFPIRQASARFGSRNKMTQSKKRIFATCNKFIEARLKESAEEKASRQPDMLDTILELDGHSEDAMACIVVEFALAGYHSTSQLLVWCLYHTCCAPDVLVNIHREIDKKVGGRPLNVPLTMDDVESLSYLKNVWQETLRLHPTGANILRMAAKDVTLKGSGFHVSKGTEIYGHVRESQRSPSSWKDATVFKPERWSCDENGKSTEQVPAGAYIPFGIGQRNCAGRFLADYESILALAELHRKFRLTLACDPSDVKLHSMTVDTPRVLDKKSGILSGVPVFVEVRRPH